MPRAQRVRKPHPPGRSLRRLSQRIREMREEAGLSQAELGEPFLTRSGVSRIEAGVSGPTFATLAHFGRKLRVRIRELIPSDL